MAAVLGSRSKRTPFGPGAVFAKSQLQTSPYARKKALSLALARMVASGQMQHDDEAQLLQYSFGFQ